MWLRPDDNGILLLHQPDITSYFFDGTIHRRIIDISRIKGDAFGKIYEYFLGKFASAEGQRGGEFYTPTSLVRLIVEILKPIKGNVYDPACGSGGMFVQSSEFIKRTQKEDPNELIRVSTLFHKPIDSANYRVNIRT